MPGRRATASDQAVSPEIRTFTLLSGRTAWLLLVTARRNASSSSPSWSPVYGNVPSNLLPCYSNVLHPLNTRAAESVCLHTVAVVCSSCEHRHPQASPGGREGLKSMGISVPASHSRLASGATTWVTIACSLMSASLVRKLPTCTRSFQPVRQGMAPLWPLSLLPPALQDHADVGACSQVNA